jgi:hypothetical protein
MLSAAAGAMQQQRSDRLVAFLATLVTYPLMFLLTKRAAAVSAVQMAGISGGMGIDTRKRLADFPEGAALLELERLVLGTAHNFWCQTARRVETGLVSALSHQTSPCITDYYPPMKVCMLHPAFILGTA